MKKNFLSIAAAAFAITAASGAVAAELPNYQKAGWPVSAVQLQVLGAENVEQASPGDTAVSPVQLGVLTPRNRITTAQGRSETVGRVIR